MIFAPDPVRAGLLIGGGLAYFLGLGWLAAGPLVHGSLISHRRVVPLLRQMALALTSGLLINYGTLLILRSLTLSLVVGAAASLAGLACFVAYLCRSSIWRKPRASSVVTWLGTGLLCLLFLAPILGQPLAEWDARSIWFFHAKMIYSAGSVDMSAGWQDPSVYFSHTAYPELVPVVAAQVAYVSGVWNEFLPKLALLFLLVPAAAWLLSFARPTISSLVLLILIPFTGGAWLWNGYMDGYLALYFSLAVLLLGRYAESQDEMDLTSGVACTMLLLNVKNEGLLAAVAFFCPAAALLVMAQKGRISKSHRALLSHGLAIIAALAPYALWHLFSMGWNTNDDFGIGSAEAASRLMDRLSDGSYWQVLSGIAVRLETPLILLGIIGFAAIVWNGNVAKESLPALAAAILYCTGVTTVYLLTQRDLAWQLETSVSRTVLPITGAVYIADYFAMAGIESPHENRPLLSKVRAEDLTT